MVKKSASDGNYEQMPQLEGAGEPYIHERRLSVKDLYYVLLKRKWIPITCLLIFVAIAAIASLRATPMYRATAQIEIEKESLNVLPFQDVLTVDNKWIDYFNTQYEILRSRTLARKVAEKLRTAGDPQDENLSGDDVRGMRRIEPVRNSRSVNIVGQSPFPEQAARVANALAEAYIEQDLEKRVEDIKGAAEKVKGELEEAKKKVDASEKEFLEYREKFNIVSLNEKQNLVLEELATRTIAAAAAGAERLRKETRYNYLKTLSLEELRHEEEVSNHEVIRKLRAEQEFQAIQNVKTLAQTYGEKHPKMIAAKEELANVQKEIDKHILKVVEEVKNSYLKAEKEEKQLGAEVEKKKQQALEFARRVSEYEGLQREVDTNKKYYQELLNRSQETDISQRTEKSSVRIVDRADVPKSPFSPRTKLNLILAVFAGLIVGCGGAFFAEHLNDKVEDPKYIELDLATPLLGAVPVISNTYGGLEDRGKIAHIAPQSKISEAYKKVLASIQYSPASNSLKTILVTSAGPAEGKTTTLTNLGISASRNGKRVLLVDCDLRKPAIHKIFGLRKKLGITEYLIGKAGFDEVLQDTKVPNLSAIARGESSPNPSGLVSSDKMKEFAELVRDKFDLVLFDSPPCTVVSDPLILANLVDAVIDVAKSGKSPKKMVETGVTDLRRVDANLLGFVLNEVNEREGRYYYYGYGYGYRYRYSYRYSYSYYTKDDEKGGGKSKKSRKGKSKRSEKDSPSSSDNLS